LSYIFVENSGIPLSKGEICKIGDVEWLSVAYGNSIYVTVGYMNII
jgi:hypothetical protein